MKPTLAQRDDFLASRPVAGIALGCNDYVNVIGGEFAGDSGSVINIEELDEDPVYCVKLDSGNQVLVAASFLQPEGDN